MFFKATQEDIKEILEFCLELKEQGAKMSFTSLDTEEKLVETFNDPLIYLFISKNEKNQVTSMFKALRGVGKKSHSVYVACAVKKEFRKKNLASSIVEYALNEIKNDGVLIARTKIYSWNKASIATIKKCGFEESGRYFMHEYEENLGMYIDDLIFHKLL